MEKQKLEMIQKLMEDLINDMEYGESDFKERLGREEPEIEAVVKMESEIPSEEISEDIEPSIEDEMAMSEEESPEESLKRRLMKLRE